MLAIIDINSGNLGSLESALKKIDVKYKICKNVQDIGDIKKIILPGVGSFPNFVKNLKLNNFFDFLRTKTLSKKISILGICVGFQALFSSSNEIEYTEGLGLINGHITGLNEKLILPHIGWNSCHQNRKSILFNGVENDADFYFCHSYAFHKIDDLTSISNTNYKYDFVSAIEYQNIFGVQFHPEKSQLNGLTILNNFSKL
jgi:glutamine amidotransferase